MDDKNSKILLAAEVRQAIAMHLPLVALESTVITHGLPYPENLQLARDMESEVRQQNAVPATVGVVDGRIYVGLDESQLEHLATGRSMVKVSVRDFAQAMVGGRSGGTTVAGTLLAANLAGLKVFATGGIGGVHRDAPFDVSTDLIGLSRTPLVVVCAGAKAILDIPATLEVLETYGVPVIGYQTDDFPAFYSRSSGLPVSARADTPGQVAQIAQAHWGLGLNSAVLVCVPPPEEVALPTEAVAGAINQALAEAQAAGIHGQAVTPFLLQRVGALTHGSSLRTNLALLRNNARVAAQIAQYLC
ncbi:MAG TPA: pseudouridine-5'-phosphate glycosidase [Anaerolineales bacterium]|nr:pseudouridine-5'-phosphate glycosidase [Anaerolineales bacterium]